MKTRSILLVGGPDSGKTNYVGRLWLALNSEKGALVAPNAPADIKYVEEASQHILQGSFAPRSDKNLEVSEKGLHLTVQLSGLENAEVAISIPDVSGELWKGVVERGDIAEEWMSQIRSSAGALIFVRVDSDQNVEPLDWVTAAKVLRELDIEPDEGEDEDLKIPTQVALCELLKLLSTTLRKDSERDLPRVAVVVTAWDRLDEGTATKGPDAYLRETYPLFWGRLTDEKSLLVRIFGVSIVGGDFVEPQFRERFYKANLDEVGYTVFGEAGEPARRVADVTLPIEWVVERLHAVG